ncbi:MAG: LptF/LptG family permease, partial [Acidobacteria bacterium]|nr:LptF/LptG family permease [Acidobacteriota bacterium]
LCLFVFYLLHHLSREYRKNALGFIGRKIYFSYKAISSRLSGWRRWDTTTQIQQSNKPFKPRRFPSRIDFYLLRNFLVTYALIQSSILGLIALIEYSDIMKFADKNHIERIVVLKYLVYRVPNLLETSLFISVLVAVLISLAVMSKNQEITAIRAAGGSLRRLCLPLLIMGVCFTAGEYYLGARFMPAANRMAMNLRYQIKNRNPGPFHKNWIRTAGGHFLNFEFYNPTERMMYNAVWYEIDFAKGGVISRTETARIQLTPEGTWVTESPGSQWRFSKVNDYIQPSPALVPKGQVLPLDVTHEDLALRERKPEEFSIAEYRSYMNYVRDLGIFHPRFPTEFYAKWTQPILPFLMVLLAAPLGFQFGRRGTFFGLSSGLVLGLAFWGLYVFFLQLGRIGLLPPVVSAWSVLVLFGVTAVFRFLQMER